MLPVIFTAQLAGTAAGRSARCTKSRHSWLLRPLGGAHGYGNVFELTPNADGSWKEKVLHQFTGGRDGANSYSGVIFDAAGNLYGTTHAGGDLSDCGGKGCGVVFKLTPKPSGGWGETVLHAFHGTPGASPYAGLIFDAAGNLYGTTSGEGRNFGSVFEITP